MISDLRRFEQSLKFYDSARIIFPDFNEYRSKYNPPFFRIDLFWDYASKNLVVEFQKTTVPDKKNSGTFLHPSKEGFFLGFDFYFADSRAFEITDYLLSLQNMEQLLRHYSAETQAKHLIRSDLSEYARLKNISENLLLKKYWLAFKKL